MRTEAEVNASNEYWLKDKLEDSGRKLELVPLGFAITANTGIYCEEPPVLLLSNPELRQQYQHLTERSKLAAADNVRPEWVRPEVAKLYKEWQSLSTVEKRWEWSFGKMQSDPLINTAIQAANHYLMPPATALEDIKAAYEARVQEQAIRKIVEATTQEQKLKAVIDLQGIFTAQSGKAIYIDPANPPDRPTMLLMRDDVPFLPKMEITAIKAKAKSGKTHLAMIYTAALIADSEVLGVTRADDIGPQRVIFIDTEQSQWDSYRFWRRSVQLAGLDERTGNERLKVINLRNLGAQERLTKVQELVVAGKYDVIVLDGIKDLTIDINDNKETDKVMSSMLSMLIPYNIAILTVLHENPSKDDNKMRGTLGTELLNKSYSVIEISLDKDAQVFNIKTSDSRSKSPNPWAFRFNDDDELEETTPTLEKTSSQGAPILTKEEKEERKYRQFLKAFEDNPNLSLTKEDIVIKLMKKTDMSENTAKRRFNQYKTAGKIVVQNADVDSQGRGIRYTLSPSAYLELERMATPEPIAETPEQQAAHRPDAEDQELPFDLG